MSKTEGQLIEKINDLLGDERELIVLKGKMYQPMQQKRQEDNKEYYNFKLKVVKKANDDIYSQGYNSYYCIMPVDVSENYSLETIREMKDNEVIVICSARASVRQFAKKETGEAVTVNNISLYVHDMMMTRHINKDVTKSKALTI